jgi:LmbE family N-acetylglucosaminyl deacetylase
VVYRGNRRRYSEIRNQTPVSIKPHIMKPHLFDILPAHRPLLLSDLPLSEPLDVVVLAPHPDDFDAIGITLRRLHWQGHTIHLAVLTTGANGIEDGWNGLQDVASKAAAREAEQRASCDFFGLPQDRLSFLRLWEKQDSNAASEAEAQELEKLRNYIQARRPDMVFLPHGNDSNRTHRRTYECFREIAVKDGLAVMACLNLDAKTLDMRTDLFTYFDEDEAQWKAKLLRLHRSQQERNLSSRGYGFDERVLKVNRNAAGKANGEMPYAEVFELQRFG